MRDSRVTGDRLCGSVVIPPIRPVMGNGSVTIWLEAAAGLELPEPSADSAVAAEGEAMLF